MHITHYILVEAEDKDMAIAEASCLAKECALGKACDYFRWEGVEKAQPEEVKKLQKEILRKALKIFQKNKSLLKEISSLSLKEREKKEREIYNLTKAFRLLDGEWIFDARFYSGPDLSVWVSKKTMNRLENLPDKF